MRSRLRLELLRARLGDPDHELSGEIDILSKEVLRLDRVVKTFLDFSRPLDVHLQDVDLGALAREVTEFVTPQARRAKIEVEFSAPSEPTHPDARRFGSAEAGRSQSGDQRDGRHEQSREGGGRLRVRVERGRAKDG